MCAALRSGEIEAGLRAQPRGDDDDPPSGSHPSGHKARPGRGQTLSISLRGHWAGAGAPVSRSTLTEYGGKVT